MPRASAKLLKLEIQTLRRSAPTYLGPLPFDLDGNALAEEERGVGGREVRILEQDPLLQTLPPQLPEGLAVRLSVDGLGRAGAPAGQSGLERHLLQTSGGEGDARCGVMERVACCVFDAGTSLSGW